MSESGGGDRKSESASGLYAMVIGAACIDLL